MNVDSYPNNDYVDIHGRMLHCHQSDTGEIFVPLNEVKKTGFHIFRKTDYDSTLVGKNLIMKEFQIYMLGAAKKYLIEHKLNSLNKDDILQTIEMCEKYIKESHASNPGETEKKGLLGRQLLADPSEISRVVQSTFQSAQTTLGTLASNNFKRSIDNNQPWESNNQCGRSGFAVPQSQQHSKDFSRSSYKDGENSTYSKSNATRFTTEPNRNLFNNTRNNSAPKNDFRKNEGDNNRWNKSKENFAPNAKVAGRREQKRESGTDTDDYDAYVKWSDLKLERVELEQNFQDVKVVYIEKPNDPEKQEKQWVQKVENEDLVNDMMEKLYHLGHSAQMVTSPKLNEMYMTCFDEDELWYRVMVMKAKPVLKVHFVDYGNEAIVSDLRHLPQDLKSIPGQAVRITLSRMEGAPAPRLAMDEVVSVKLIKKFDDTTSLVLKSNNSKSVNFQKPATQTEKSPEKLETHFMHQIKYSTILEDKENVKIVGHSEGKMYLRNKVHHDKLRDLNVNAVKDLPKVVLKEIEVGQVVLCKKEGEDQMCRAVIRKIDNGLVTVHFVDFFSTDNIPIKALHGVSRAVATWPATLIESPPIRGYEVEKKFSPEAEAKLEDLINRKVKLTVSSTGTEFDLLIEAKRLSELLFPNEMPHLKPQPILRPPHQTPPSSKVADKKTSPIVSPPSASATTTTRTVAATPPPPPKPTKYEKISFEEMQAFELKMGMGDYMVVNYNDLEDFTVTPTGDEETELLTLCTDMEVNDDEPYEPEDQEMVLAKFEDCWYRGAILETLDNGQYQILFVEYGNIVNVTKNEIRKFPNEFRKIPMLGLSCFLNVPNTVAVKKRLTELITQNNIYEMNILSYEADSLIYKVEIPKISDILKKEGLI